jgi:hypothetical protein
MENNQLLSEIAKKLREIKSELCCLNGGTPSSSSSLSLATQNPTITKASGGVLTNVAAFNLNAAPVYLKFYDKATAPASTDTPVLRYMIPGNTAGAGFTINPDHTFVNGISWRLVTGILDNSTGAPTANEQLVNIEFN